MSSQNHITALALELHTHIFSYFQPYDILQVSQTCQALYRASLQRTVWTDALHRICVQNTLFEPSFPVASMSVLELQRASMGPHRWIAKSSSKKRNSDGVLPHSVTQHRMSAMSDLSIADLRSLCNDHYLVPGGRYLFSLSYDRLVLWDLGSPYSSGIEPHSVAAVPAKFKSKTYDQYLVHSTPDEMGLRVSFFCDCSSKIASAYIYEIYPESTSPQFTQIAYTQIPNSYGISFSLSYDRLTIIQENLLTVWDYKANTWARWSIEKGPDFQEVLDTEFAVVLMSPISVVVWKIPQLLPESSFSMITDPPEIDPDLVLQFLKRGDLGTYQQFHQVPCGWCSTLRHLYFDVELYAGSPIMIDRFKVTINSEVCGGTLDLVNTYTLSIPLIKDYDHSLDVRICQDKNVRLCIDPETNYLATHVTHIISDRQLSPLFTTLSSHPIDLQRATICLATGRLVYCLETELAPSIMVLDF